MWHQLDAGRLEGAARAAMRAELGEAVRLAAAGRTADEARVALRALKRAALRDGADVQTWFWALEDARRAALVADRERALAEGRAEPARREMRTQQRNRTGSRIVAVPVGR